MRVALKECSAMACGAKGIRRRRQFRVGPVSWTRSGACEGDEGPMVCDVVWGARQESITAIW